MVRQLGKCIVAVLFAPFVLGCIIILMIWDKVNGN